MKTKKQANSGIRQAVAATAVPADGIPGSNNRLAKLIGVDRQLVDYWVKTGRPSPEHCQRISELTGIGLHELRPDIYPKL